MIYGKLVDHVAEWEDIGKQLGFKEGELKGIKAKPMLMMEAPKSWLKEMLSQWLQWGPGDGRGSPGFATKEMLCTALKNANLSDVAEKF